MNTHEWNLKAATLGWLVIFSVMMLCGSALAEDEHDASEGKPGGLSWDRFSVNGGVFITAASGDIRVDAVYF